jgi:hypothetical protein
LGGGLYAKEAVDQLVQLMTAVEHKNKTCVILAGYTVEMDRMVANANTGLASRFEGRLDFPDWEPKECVTLIVSLSRRKGVEFIGSAEDDLEEGIRKIKELPKFANARDCNVLFGFLDKARAMRPEHDRFFTPSDVEFAVNKVICLRPEGANEPAAAWVGMQQVPIQHMPPPPPDGGPRIVELEIESELEETEGGAAEKEEEAVAVDPSDGAGGDDSVYKALLLACKKAGYDETHERRKDLVAILQTVKGGGDFPDDIMLIVIEETKLSKAKATKMLKPQLQRVLSAMEESVEAEEERLREIERMEAAERARAQAEFEKIQQKLKHIGQCCMGFTWHRNGTGWRCAGGSHYVTDADLGL